MDWKLPIVSNLWAFPRGMTRDGAAGPRSAEWSARYGSVIVSGYEIATTDGLNEAGLMANLLWEVEATYPGDDGVTPRVSLSVFAQYLLDRYATVAEAVEDLRENSILVAGGEVPIGPPGRAATVHVSLSDATGDSAIIEFVNGEMVVWHDRSYQIMPNEPTFERQLAILEYWQGVNPPPILARHRPRHRPLRARASLHQLGGAKRRSPHRRRLCLQRDPPDLGALGHLHRRPAEPVDDPLARRGRPQGPALLR